MSDKSNIVLIGMPGAGKSTVGSMAAKALGKRFVDTDLLIEDRHGDTAQNLIDRFGAKAFIDIENEVLRELEVDDCVISTGGSAVYSEDGMRHLRDIGTIVYIRATPQELASHISGFDGRGVVVLDGCDPTIEGLLSQRSPLYEQYAEIVIDSNGDNAEEVSERLIVAIEELA